MVNYFGRIFSIIFLLYYNTKVAWSIEWMWTAAFNCGRRLQINLHRLKLIFVWHWSPEIELMRMIEGKRLFQWKLCSTRLEDQTYNDDYRDVDDDLCYVLRWIHHHHHHPFFHICCLVLSSLDVLYIMATVHYIKDCNDNIGFTFDFIELDRIVIQTWRRIVGRHTHN